VVALLPHESCGGATCLHVADLVASKPMTAKEVMDVPLAEVRVTGLGFEEVGVSVMGARDLLRDPVEWGRVDDLVRKGGVVDGGVCCGERSASLWGRERWACREGLRGGRQEPVCTPFPL